MFTLLVSRADKLKAIGEFDAAISEYRRAIDLENDLSPAWLNLGVSLTSLDREDEAIDIYKVQYLDLTLSAGKMGHSDTMSHICFQRTKAVGP